MGEVMSHVHGDRIDRSRGAVSTRWWGLGILSLARLTARGLLTSWDRTEGVEARRSAREAGIRHVNLLDIRGPWPFMPSTLVSSCVRPLWSQA